MVISTERKERQDSLTSRSVFSRGMKSKTKKLELIDIKKKPMYCNLYYVTSRCSLLRNNIHRCTHWIRKADIFVVALVQEAVVRDEKVSLEKELSARASNTALQLLVE